MANPPPGAPKVKTHPGSLSWTPRGDRDELRRQSGSCWRFRDPPENLSVMDGEWTSCDDGDLTKPRMEAEQEEAEGGTSCSQETMLRNRWVQTVCKGKCNINMKMTPSAKLSNVSNSRDCSSSESDLVEHLMIGVDDGVGSSKGRNLESQTVKPQNDHKLEKTSGSAEQLTRNPADPTRSRTLHCSVCEKCFTRKDNFLIHQRIHRGEKPFACLECDKSFSRKSTLHHHEQLHTGERPFACLECEKCFTTSSCLAKHKRSHTGERPFACTTCEKRFYRRAHLQNHLRTHTQEKSFACFECGKFYTSSTILAAHQRIHTGEKPYECPECGKCFRTRQVLVVHERTHTGEKPYACSNCGKMFSSMSNLIAHEKAHRGDKPYECSECGKCFLRRTRLMRHERIHTRGKTFACP